MAKTKYLNPFETTYPVSYGNTNSSSPFSSYSPSQSYTPSSGLSHSGGGSHENYAAQLREAISGVSNTLFGNPNNTSSGTVKGSIYGVIDKDAANAYSDDYSSSYSGGGVALPSRIDLTDMLNAFEQQAEANRQQQLNTRNVKRADLLSAIERFREDTAESRARQRSAYNSQRADLEEAAFMANRSAMQSAAARGLGGSGLQQLSQLQNLMESGRKVNTAAQANQQVQNDLTKALQRQEADYNTNVKNLEDAYNLAIQNINANLANQRAQAIYNEDVRYANALQSARQANASIAASQSASREARNDLMRTGVSTLNATMDDAITALRNASNASYKKSADRNKALQDIYSTYRSEINNVMAGSQMTPSQMSAYRGQLENYFNQFLNK